MKSSTIFRDNIKKGDCLIKKNSTKSIVEMVLPIRDSLDCFIQFKGCPTPLKFNEFGDCLDDKAQSIVLIDEA